MICTLLFVATTINYIDRQVIGLLKPSLQHQFAWTERDYAAIVFTFQLAYAIGLLHRRPGSWTGSARSWGSRSPSCCGASRPSATRSPTGCPAFGSRP
jgi:hypothetical protein